MIISKVNRAKIYDNLFQGASLLMIAPCGEISMC